VTLLVRSATLSHYAELARAVGLDPLRLLAEHDLPASSLADPDLFIPADAVYRLFEVSAARSGVIDFGLRLAEMRQLSDLGAVGLVMREQPTLRAAIETCINYIWMNSQALSLRLEITDDVGIVHFSHPAATSVGPQIIEGTVATIVRTLRHLLGNAWRPDAIAFMHAAPADLTTHRRVLGLTPTFGEAFIGVVIPVAGLAAPVAGADPVIGRRLERYLALTQATRRDGPVFSARELILALLPTGACSTQRIAQHMGIDRRTLHRRLAEGGVTYRGLLDEAREQLVTAYLEAGERSLTEIADLLGYSSLSAFSRWHKERFGVAPSDAARTGRRQAG
jgi:AraC-like DNA-binding protein